MSLVAICPPRHYARCQKQTEACTSGLNHPPHVNSPATYLIRRHLLAGLLPIPCWDIHPRQYPWSI
jgi:hypothetical protein